MARGKFNKRGGGPRLDAVSAEEIELRNQRLAELEEQRAQRRADEEDGGEGEGGDAEGGDQDASETEAVSSKKPKDPSAKPKQGPGAGAPAPEVDHNKNLRKLAEVRKRREEAEAKRKAEEEAVKELEEARKQEAWAVTGDGASDQKKESKKKTEKIPKLDKIAIKKMKPAQMKEALKLRGLDIQGNAKALTDRLLKYEAER